MLTKRRRATWWGVLAYLSAAATGLAESARQQPAPSGFTLPPAPAWPSSSMAELVPAVRDAPAPAWVRPGIRLTYKSGAGFIATDRWALYRDDYGGWVDEHDRRYRLEKVEGQANVGYSQVNVAAVTPEAVALDGRSYGLTQLDGPCRFLAATGVVGPPGSCGDWWMNPRVLANVAGGQIGALRVLRMPYPLGGHTYQALRFHYETAGTRCAYVFDLESGILLHVTSASIKGDAFGKVGQFISYSTFMNRRQLRAPWIGQAAPDWLAGLNVMQFTGNHIVSIPGSPILPLQAGLQLRITRRGPNWALYAGTQSIGGVSGVPPATSQTTRVSGTASFGGLWIPPAAMPALQAGQTLDQDAITGVTTSVSHVGPLQQVQMPDAVVISEVGPIQRIDYAYAPANGMLTYFRQVDTPLNSQLQFKLSGHR